MEYGNGNGNGQYQSMESYGMSAADGQCQDMGMGGGMGQDYGGQSSYGGQSGYGGGGMYDDSRNCQSGSAAFGGPGYRSPLRYNKVMKEMNSRNGLYSPEQRAGRGNGDYYNSLPGIGGHEGAMYQSRNNNNQSYY
ncbi:heterogeneous nuclear ribonucleoprotein A2 homolog 1 [Drosophila busckii]|uniref:heterogeneous nuclear ribonucleoprotein A2 homolog 1 n=1 Tax=Drosophila busckii TaxID=30019 RepID=UPI001432CD9D|nr:heterogeneous nuclear ribonucleoprotein A2 homolog 1 [Drosophila busckii]